MTKAEQAALKAYPELLSGSIFGPLPVDLNKASREKYQEGYEQAWKDIKEWVEEQVTILDKQTLLHPDDDVFWAQRSLFKEMKDKLNSL